MAVADTYCVAEGGTLTTAAVDGVLSNDTDAENDTLSAVLVSGPANAASFSLVGDVAGRDVVIYDDMIRSGGSLVQAARAYADAGARSVHAATTHLVIPGDAIERLEASPLVTVIGTDSHPAHESVSGRARFRVLPVAPLFAEILRRSLG